ncbi:MAG: hypothetical protein SGILL_010746, partial [Bacillariaceae sp.]
ASQDNDHATSGNGGDSGAAVFDGVSMVKSNAPDATTATKISSHTHSTAAAEMNQVASSSEQLITGAALVEELFDDTPPIIETIPEETSDEDAIQTTPSTFEMEGGGIPEETLPLTAHDFTSKSYQSSHSFFGSGSIKSASETNYSSKVGSLHTSYNSKQQHPHHYQATSPAAFSDPTQSPKTRAKLFRQKSVKKKKQLPSSWLRVLCWNVFHPLPLLQGFWYFLTCHTNLVTVALPLFFMAYMFYYAMGNPQWSFLPGHASMAWWCNFLGRQVLVLDLARLVQWCFIDKIVLGTRIAVKCLGPLLTLCFIQARGWPFVVALWGFLDLILLEGRGQFEQHWLYFVPQIGLYDNATVSGDDSGSYILNSDIYVRLLLSMLLAGVAFAGKRTWVAMYFGRRTFVAFKPRLEKLLKEVVLVSEVAALADEAEIVETEEEENNLVVEMRAPQPRKVPGGLDRSDKIKVIGGVSWRENKSKRARTMSEGELPASPGLIVNAKKQDDGSDDEEDEDDEDDDDEEDESELNTQKGVTLAPKLKSSRLNSRRALLNLLEHWEEPVNRADKSLNASISDILRFRRALTFMDDNYPFGEAFGPAGTREQVVASSSNVY